MICTLLTVVVLVLFVYRRFAYPRFASPCEQRGGTTFKLSMIVGGVHIFIEHCKCQWGRWTKRLYRTARPLIVWKTNTVLKGGVRV